MQTPDTLEFVCMHLYSLHAFTFTMCRCWHLCTHSLCLWVLASLHTFTYSGCRHLLYTLTLSDWCRCIHVYILGGNIVDGVMKDWIAPQNEPRDHRMLYSSPFFTMLPACSSFMVKGSCLLQQSNFPPTPCGGWILYTWCEEWMCEEWMSIEPYRECTSALAILYKNMPGEPNFVARVVRYTKLPFPESRNGAFHCLAVEYSHFWPVSSTIKMVCGCVRCFNPCV